MTVAGIVLTVLMMFLWVVYHALVRVQQIKHAR